MSIRIGKEIHCDGCGWWEPLEADLVRTCWPSMRREGWTRGKGKHYCPGCGFEGNSENHPKSQAETLLDAVEMEESL